MRRNRGEQAAVKTVEVDFGRITGRMKPRHGVNNGPKTYAFHYNMSKYFVEAGIPYARLHDTEYPYGSGHFVDIPCIFRDFNADPDNPASYDFALTDEYIKAIHTVGTKVFYRLGVSIEHAARKYEIFPPKDYGQWARICAGIIRHYNEGWAGGFHYGIEYWEIWNECAKGS
jgi:xylan 1,4-beta-xylosidase